MEITLTKEESEKVFFDALCNGLTELSCHGIGISYKEHEYQKAKESLKVKSKTDSVDFCYEDVLMEILRMGFSIGTMDLEGGPESEYSVSITLSHVHDRVQLTPVEQLIDAIKESGDATTADCVLQSVFFKEIVFA